MALMSEEEEEEEKEKELDKAVEEAVRQAGEERRMRAQGAGGTASEASLKMRRGFLRRLEN